MQPCGDTGRVHCACARLRRRGWRAVLARAHVNTARAPLLQSIHNRLHTFIPLSPPNTAPTALRMKWLLVAVLLVLVAHGAEAWFTCKKGDYTCIDNRRAWAA